MQSFLGQKPEAACSLNLSDIQNLHFRQVYASSTSPVGWLSLFLSPACGLVRLLQHREMHAKISVQDGPQFIIMSHSVESESIGAASIVEASFLYFAPDAVSASLL
jgi:hypothetical protein